MSEDIQGGMLLHFKYQEEEWRTNHLSQGAADFLMTAYMAYIADSGKLDDRDDNLIVKIVKSSQEGRLSAEFLRESFSQYCQFERIATETVDEAVLFGDQRCGEEGGMLWAIGGNQWGITPEAFELCVSAQWAQLRNHGPESAEENLIAQLLNTFGNRKLDSAAVQMLYEQYVENARKRDETMKPVPLYRVPEVPGYFKQAKTGHSISNVAATVGHPASVAEEAKGTNPERLNWACRDGDAFGAVDEDGGHLQEDFGPCEKVTKAELIVLIEVLSELRGEEINEDSEKHGITVGNPAILCRGAARAARTMKEGGNPLSRFMDCALYYYRNGELDSGFIQALLETLRKEEEAIEVLVEKAERMPPEALQRLLNQAEAATA